MTMGIKKTAHNTYTVQRNATISLGCAIDSRLDFANDFVNSPYDTVLCNLTNLKDVMNGTAPGITQAAGRSFQGNYAISTVYTY